MSHICVTHSHSLGSKRIQEESEKLAMKLVARYGGKYFRHEDRVAYSNSGIEAVISYDATRLKVEVDMGVMMRVFRKAIEAEINEYLNKNYY